MSTAPNDAISTYEIEVAPLLMQVAAVCKKHGLSLAAFVETGVDVRETSYLKEGYSFAMHSGILAFRAGGNVDAYINSVIELSRKTGHNSELLALLAVPKVPTTPVLPQGG